MRAVLENFLDRGVLLIQLDISVRTSIVRNNRTESIQSVTTMLGVNFHIKTPWEGTRKRLLYASYNQQQCDPAFPGPSAKSSPVYNFRETNNMNVR
jgi:hypothetical protein